MPITNLAIQRKRWKELKELFKNNPRVNSINPLLHDRHDKFVIHFDKLDYQQLETLRNEGWKIVGINPLTTYSCYITVYKFEFEKQTRYVRRVSETYKIKDFWQLNAKLKDLYIQELEQTKKDLYLENSKLRKQIENLEYLHELTGFQEVGTK